MGELAVMDNTGDSKTMWNKNSPAEVEQARNVFNELTKKGYQAFTVRPDGEAGERIDRFDAEIEKMVLIPRMVGG